MPKVKNLDLTKKPVNQKEKENGKQVIRFETTETVQPVVKNVTILELIKDAQNCKNYYIQSKEYLDTAWNTLSSDEKQEYLSEYNLTTIK